MIYLSDIINAPFVLSKEPTSENFAFTTPSIFNENRKLDFMGASFELDNGTLKPVDGEYVGVNSIVPTLDTDGKFTNTLGLDIKSFSGTENSSVVEARITDKETNISSIIMLPVLDNKIDLTGLSTETVYDVKVRVKNDDFTGAWSEPFVLTTPSTMISDPIITLKSNDSLVTDIKNTPLLLSLDVSGFAITDDAEELKSVSITITDEAGIVVNTFTLTDGSSSVVLPEALDIKSKYIVSAKFSTDNYTSATTALTFSTMDATEAPKLSTGGTNVDELSSLDVTITNFKDSFKYRVVGAEVSSIRNNVFTIEVPSVIENSNMDVSFYAKDIVNNNNESIATKLSLNIRHVETDLDQSFMITSDVVGAVGGDKDDILTDKNGMAVNSIDIKDHSKSSSTTKIYVDNKLIDLKEGNTLLAENGELFNVKSVNEEGEVIEEIKAISIFCGSNHTFIVDSDGNLLSTGYNGNGELGLGDTDNRSSFTDTGINNPKDVTCGGFHTFIVDSDGNLLSTGRNNEGQLGLGDRESERALYRRTHSFL